MKNITLHQQLEMSNQFILNTINKIQDDQLKYRLTENTASVGFLLQHIVETQLTFNRMIFGVPIDFTPKTFRVESDKDLVFDINEIKDLYEKGKAALSSQVLAADDAFLNEHIKTFMGDQTRIYMIFYLFHHTSYHLGQAELAIKKGRVI